ncbi:HAD family hydrolase [Salipiger bermudensis]|uniref:phosphoglycolate phosphatase n=1 Tax=Salipiger bermudensis (strain DSM 26914 / JCM 13377 / KCTC 12554 / HTCC2601) TaxID=314265 RepID=Q0FSW9_SALBH|nr:HAD family hydrolase [Salipiger bermudensis]EAU47400.1 HAD-superfamily hydrolase, subfamily IA, variant 1 family protein [Salipiger bermudensis HTCC2601]
MRLRADAVLFDKDGTLFEFGATWNAWGREALQHLSEGCEATLLALAEAARFDLETQSFRADSPVVAGTNREAAACLASVLPGRSASEVEAYLEISGAEAPLVEAAPLVPLMAQLEALGLALGVMTNDAESVAHAHLGHAGIRGVFDFIAGFDSGFGAKPDPAPLLAFADRLGLAPGRIVMVGDSPHDLTAGRAAGMQTVAVLTGPIAADSLAPLADAVLPDVGHLPGWLTAI